MKDYLNQLGVSRENQIKILEEIRKQVDEGKDEYEATKAAFEKYGQEMSRWNAAGNMVNIFNGDKLLDAWGVGFRAAGGLFGGQGMDYVYNYARMLNEQNAAISKNRTETDLAVAATNKYATTC